MFPVHSAERPVNQGFSGYFPPPDSAGGWRAATNAAQIRELAGMDLPRLEQAWEFTQRCTQSRAARAMTGSRLRARLSSKAVAAVMSVPEMVSAAVALPGGR